MRIPRDVNGQEQHLTIPAHKLLRVGTLRQILKDLAAQLGCSIEKLIGSLDLWVRGSAAERSDEHAAHHAPPRPLPAPCRATRSAAGGRDRVEGNRTDP